MLPLAEEGDPKAQTYVGDIYERGLTGSPDDATAAAWYRRAAEQGYASAQVSLGQLYERGAGVPQDRVRAMNLYREASGLPEPLEIVAAAELQDLRASAGARDQEVGELEGEVERLRQGLDAARAEQQGAAQAEQAAPERARQELLEQQAALERSRQALLEQQAELEAAEAGRDAAAIARAQGVQQQLEQLKLREAELAQKEQELARTEQDLTRTAQELAQKEQELAEIEAELIRNRSRSSVYPLPNRRDPSPESVSRRASSANTMLL